MVSGCALGRPPASILTPNKLKLASILLFSLVVLLQPLQSSADVCADYYRLLDSFYPNLTALIGDPATFVGRYIEQAPRIDRSASSPHPLEVQGDLVHVRYSGFITPPVTGWYFFSFAADDGFLFYLNGSSSPLLQNGATIFSDINSRGQANFTVYLEANVTIPFLADLQERKGIWTLLLYWEVTLTDVPGLNITVPMQEIPASVFSVCNTLAPAIATFDPPPIAPALALAFNNSLAYGTGFCGHFFTSDRITSFTDQFGGVVPSIPSVSDYSFSRLDSGIDYAVPRYLPIPGLPHKTTAYPGFSIAWQGFFIPPQTGSYSLFVVAGIESRVFLNGQRVLNQISREGAYVTAELSTAFYNLTAGQLYFLDVLYGEPQSLPMPAPPALYEGSYRTLLYNLDWYFMGPDMTRPTRARVPASALRTINCPSATLTLRPDLGGNAELKNGSYALAANTTINGNLTLTNSVLFISGNTTATITGTIFIGNSSQLVVTPGSSVSIAGNITFAGNNTITISSSTSSSSPIVVSGSVALSGATIVIKVSNVSLEELRRNGSISVNVAQYSSSDGGAPGDINPQVAGLRPCEKVVGTAVNGPTDFSVILRLDDSGCLNAASAQSFPTWAIVVIVLGVVVIAGVIAIVGWRLRRKQEHSYMRKIRSVPTGHL